MHDFLRVVSNGAFLKLDDFFRFFYAFSTMKMYQIDEKNLSKQKQRKWHQNIKNGNSNAVLQRMFLEFVVRPISTWSIVSKVIFTGRNCCTRYHWIQWWFFWFFYCLIETANSTKHTREIRDFKLPLCGRAFCDVIVMSTVVRSYLFQKLCRFKFTTEFSDFAGRISAIPYSSSREAYVDM